MDKQEKIGKLNFLICILQWDFITISTANPVVLNGGDFAPWEYLTCLETFWFTTLWTEGTGLPLASSG